ncbi:DUF4829 domain-containing protein [Terrisporobacter mayombei]|uniref:DUF4829 domain-containing protein n=1 Tax=Terrisporobacter mayombei TaxID=1541 RepID=A0ABY9PY89_9FIRM|nr:DUF4829 domain-containing protein [Terrisporobacter mayombei]WMT80677.1 hypothetical protein TEMA_09980 [Terrisporobacter mayombei]
MSKKSKLICLIFAVCIIGIVLYFLRFYMHWDVDNVNQSISHSEVYSNQDIDTAMNIVKREFRDEFKGCVLTDLWYNEDISISSSDEWAKQYNSDEAIILLSNFDVDSSGGDGSLDPNSTYTDWQWILVRDRENSKWTLKTWGY